MILLLGNRIEEEQIESLIYRIQYLTSLIDYMGGLIKRRISYMSSKNKDIPILFDLLAPTNLKLLITDLRTYLTDDNFPIEFSINQQVLIQTLIENTENLYKGNDIYRVSTLKDNKRLYNGIDDIYKRFTKDLNNVPNTLDEINYIRKININDIRFEVNEGKGTLIQYLDMIIRTLEIRVIVFNEMMTTINKDYTISYTEGSTLDIGDYTEAEVIENNRMHRYEDFSGQSFNKLRADFSVYAKSFKNYTKYNNMNNKLKSNLEDIINNDENLIAVYFHFDLTEVNFELINRKY